MNLGNWMQKEKHVSASYCRAQECKVPRDSGVGEFEMESEFENFERNEQ